MTEIIDKLYASRPFRYIFIGGIAYIFELSVLLLLAEVFMFSSWLSVAYSFWVGLFVSFVLQKYIAFNNKSSDKKTLGKQALLYGVLVLFNYAFTILFVSLFTDIINLVIARTIALLLTVTWNYFMYKRIFK